MDEQVAANVRQQISLYGRPLGEVVRDVTTALGINQGRLADVLGMSAPMLSQLASGRRVKIGNPQAVARLQSLLDLCGVAATLKTDEVERQIEQIASTSATITTSTPSDPLIHQLRAIAGSPDALLAAARASEIHSPALATLLRRAASHG